MYHNKLTSRRILDSLFYINLECIKIGGGRGIFVEVYTVTTTTNDAPNKAHYL